MKGSIVSCTDEFARLSAPLTVLVIVLGIVVVPVCWPLVTATLTEGTTRCPRDPASR
jgi:hypothetical protein